MDDIHQTGTGLGITNYSRDVRDIGPEVAAWSVGNGWHPPDYTGLYW